MRNIIVDSSVVIKWYFERDEKDLEKAHQILQLIGTDSLRLIAPEIIRLELANAAKFAKHQTQEKCLEAVSSFSCLVEEFTPLPSVDLIINQIYKHNLTSYDAVFVALAEETNIPLITADYRHHKKEVSKNIVWLSEWQGKL